MQEYPDTLTARSNRAYSTGEAGDLTAADQYADLLPTIERVLGTDAPPDPDRPATSLAGPSGRGQPGGSDDCPVSLTIICGRKAAPVFVTQRRARVALPAADLDEHGCAQLSYQ